MKRSLKLLIIFILVLSTTTGCMKLNYSMGIKKDKSLDLKIIFAVDKSMQESGESSVDLDAVSKLAEKGYYVGAYNEGKFKGYEVTKSFKNIDSISTASNDELVVDLSDFLNEDKDIENLFIVKKGLFKNTYKARFKMSTDQNLTEGNSGSIDDESLSDDELLNSTSDMEDEYLQAISMLDLKFTVSVPYKTLSNNASSVSSDENTLTWNLLELQNKNIEFDFQLYNWTNIIICVALIIIIIIAIIVLIRKSSNKKKQINYMNNENLVVEPINREPVTNQEFVNQIDPNNPSLTFMNQPQEVKRRGTIKQ